MGDHGDDSKQKGIFYLCTFIVLIVSSLLVCCLICLAIVWVFILVLSVGLSSLAFYGSSNSIESVSPKPNNHDSENYYDPRRSDVSQYLFSIDFSMDEERYNCSGQVHAEVYGILDVEFSDAVFNGSVWIQDENSEKFVENSTVIESITFLVDGQYSYTFRYDNLMRPVEITLLGHKKLMLNWDDSGSNMKLDITSIDLLSRTSLVLSADSSSFNASEALYNESKLANNLSTPSLTNLLCYHTLNLSDSQIPDGRRSSPELIHRNQRRATRMDDQEHTETVELDSLDTRRRSSLGIAIQEIMKPLKDGLMGFLPNVQLEFDFNLCGIEVSSLTVRLVYPQGSVNYKPVHRDGSRYGLRFFASSYSLVRHMSRLDKIIGDARGGLVERLLLERYLGSSPTDVVFETLNHIWKSGGLREKTLDSNHLQTLVPIIDTVFASYDVLSPIVDIASSPAPLATLKAAKYMFELAELSLHSSSYLEQYTIDSGKVPILSPGKPIGAYVDFEYVGENGKIVEDTKFLGFIEKAGSYFFSVSASKRSAVVNYYKEGNNVVVAAKYMDVTDRMVFTSFSNVCFVSVRCCYPSVGCNTQTSDCTGMTFSNVYSPNSEVFYESVPVVATIPFVPYCSSNIGLVVTLTAQIVDVDDKVKSESSVTVVVF